MTAPETHSEVRKRLEKAIAEFNERAKTDPKMREVLENKERRIQLEISDESTYNFHLKDYAIAGVNLGPVNEPEINVATDKGTFIGIIDGEVSPTRAFLLKKLKFKAKDLEDLILLRKLF